MHHLCMVVVRGSCQFTHEMSNKNLPFAATPCAQFMIVSIMKSFGDEIYWPISDKSFNGRQSSRHGHGDKEGENGFVGPFVLTHAHQFHVERRTFSANVTDCVRVCIVHDRAEFNMPCNSHNK